MASGGGSPALSGAGTPLPASNSGTDSPNPHNSLFKINPANILSTTSNENVAPTSDGIPKTKICVFCGASPGNSPAHMVCTCQLNPGMEISIALFSLLSSMSTRTMNRRTLDLSSNLSKLQYNLHVIPKHRHSSCPFKTQLTHSPTGSSPLSSPCLPREQHLSRLRRRNSRSHGRSSTYACLFVRTIISPRHHSSSSDQGSSISHTQHSTTSHPSLVRPAPTSFLLRTNPSLRDVPQRRELPY